MDLRDNWRVILLVIFLVVSTFAILAPGIGGGSQDGALTNETESSGPTNLQFGLELSGGTRIRAPVDGLTAEDVDVPRDRNVSVQDRVARNLEGVSPSDVKVRLAAAQNETTTVEVFSKNVTRDEFAAALEQEGYDYETIRPGVTDATRNTVVRILRDKVSEAGLSGGRVQQVETANGENFVVIEMPNTNRSEVEDLVTERGQVQVVAGFPAQNQSGNDTQYRREPLLTQGDFKSIGTAQETRSGPNVPLVQNDETARNYSNVRIAFE
jgi:preprotein translocase subunit SecD